MPLTKFKTNKSSVPHFIGYLRVSLERDVTGSHTFETQEKRIREYLDQRCGVGQYTLELFKDDGLSGGYGIHPSAAQPKVRPTLRLIEEKICSGGCDALVVYGQSRLFRNAGALIELVAVLNANQTLLLSATEDLDITTTDGRTMAFIKGIIDQSAREESIKRCKDAAATRAEGGYWVGQVPYGWIGETQDGRQIRGQRPGIIPVPEQQQWVLYMKDRFLSGWNPYRIAAELNERQVPTPLQRELWRKKAAKHQAKYGHAPQWSQAVVWRIINSPAHVGLVHTPSGEMVKGQHWEHRY